MSRTLDGAELAVDDLLREVRAVLVQSRRIVEGAHSGARLATFLGPGLEFAEVREYVYGDDRRRIDQPVSARMGRPFVRTYVDEREQSIVFVCDRSASMIGGAGAQDLSRLSARVIGALSLAAVRHGDKVGLMLTGERVDLWLPLRKGMAQVSRLLRECLLARPRGKSSGLSAGLLRLHQVLKRPAVVVILSDFLVPGLDEPLLQLSKKHDVIAIRLSPAKRAWPKAGVIRLEDPEGGVSRRVDLSDPRVREALESAETGAKAAFRSLAQKTRISTLELHAAKDEHEDPVTLPLRRFFAARNGRRLLR